MNKKRKKTKPKIVESITLVYYAEKFFGFSNIFGVKTLRKSLFKVFISCLRHKSLTV